MTNPFPAPRRRWVWPIAVVLVTLVALGLRWYYISAAQVVEPIRGDTAQYLAYAWNVFHHGVFSDSLPGSGRLIPSSYRDPGYPAFLAFWMMCFGNGDAWYASVLRSQVVLSALTVACAMQLGRRWLDWRWVVVAGFLLAVWPHNIAIAGDLLTETLFGFICALGMLLCARACDRQSVAWGIAAGLCFGAAALTNAVLLPFGVLLALYLAWRQHISRRLWVALMIASLVLPGAWAVRNSRLPAKASDHSSMTRALQNLVQGSWPTYHSAYHAAVFHNSAPARRTLAAIDAEIDLLQAHPRQGIATIVHRLGEHPWHSLAWYMLEKPRILWGWRIRVGQTDIEVYPTRNSPFDRPSAMRVLASACRAVNPILAVLLLACLVLALARRGSWKTRADGRAMLEATLVLAVFVTLVYSVLQSAPRYSIPFRSFEMLLAMTTASALVAWVRNRIRAARCDRPNASPAGMRRAKG